MREVWCLTAFCLAKMTGASRYLIRGNMAHCWMFQGHLSVMMIWRMTGEDETYVHDGTTLIVFDVPSPDRAIENNVLGEALFPEISNRMVIGVGEKMHTGRRLFNMILEMVHQMRSVAFNLLSTSDCTKHNLGKSSGLKRSIGNPAHDL